MFLCYYIIIESFFNNFILEFNFILIAKTLRKTNILRQHSIHTSKSGSTLQNPLIPEERQSSIRILVFLHTISFILVCVGLRLSLMMSELL